MKKILVILLLTTFLLSFVGAAPAETKLVTPETLEAGECKDIVATQCGNNPNGSIELPKVCREAERVDSSIEIEDNELDFLSDGTLDCRNYNHLEFNRAMYDDISHQNNILYKMGFFLALPIAFLALLIRIYNDNRYYLLFSAFSAVWPPLIFVFSALIRVFSPWTLLAPLLVPPISAVILAQKEGKKRRIVPSLVISALIFLNWLIFMLSYAS